VIKKFIHILLASSVFLSSGGLLVNYHFCQDEFLKTSFFFSFGSCCEKVESSPCSIEKTGCSADDHEEDEKGCCKNKADFYKLDQDQQIQKIEFKSFDRLISWNAIVPALNSEFPSSDKFTRQYYNYSPPLIVFDRQVRLQTFLC
jgi:hypothetical protein